MDFISFSETSNPGVVHTHTHTHGATHTHVSKLTHKHSGEGAMELTLTGSERRSD